MRTLELKKDKYRRSRGGYARFLLISCSNCYSPIFLYQKDGPGPLKRTYLDRIHAPNQYAQYQYLNINEIPKLICSKCNQIIGTPYIYKKEKRNAFLMKQGTFSKIVTKGIFPAVKI